MFLDPVNSDLELRASAMRNSELAYCNFALLLLVVVLYLVESTKLQTVDKSIKLKKQQLLILPRIALENMLKYLFPLGSFHS